MSAPHPAPGYRTLLRLPGVPSFFLSALVGRLSYGTVGLALLLLIHDATGSYGDAGAALAGYGLASAVLAPVRSRQIDRYGIRRVLPLLAICYAVVLLAIAAAGFHGHPSTGMLAGLTVAAGCLAPPLGPATRRVWSEVATDEALLRGVLAGVTSPAYTLVATAALVTAGTLAMVASPLLTSAAPQRRTGDGVHPLRRVAFRRLLVVVFGIGAGLGGIDLAVVDGAQHHGGAGLTGALLAVLSLGSAVGGAAYGHRAWQVPATRQLPAITGPLSMAILLLALVSSPPLVAGVLFVTGLFVAPALIVGYTVSDVLSDPATRTEAGTWVNSLLNLGLAAGTAVAGLLLDVSGPRTTLLTAVVVVLLTTVVGSRLGRTDSVST